jgi:hypothetical protein
MLPVKDWLFLIKSQRPFAPLRVPKRMLFILGGEGEFGSSPLMGEARVGVKIT